MGSGKRGKEEGREEVGGKDSEDQNAFETSQRETHLSRLMSWRFGEDSDREGEDPERVQSDGDCASEMTKMGGERRAKRKDGSSFDAYRC